MPVRAAYRHRSNRRPRPSLVTSPPTPITVVTALQTNAGADNQIVLFFSGPVAAEDGLTTGIVIVETSQAAQDISQGDEVPTNQVFVNFSTLVDRRGMHIQLTQPTLGISGVQLPLLPQITVVITGP
jgi:hypothetical protein